MAPRYKDISTRTKISSQLRSTQARQGELIGTDLPYDAYVAAGEVAALMFPTGRLTKRSGNPVPPNGGTNGNIYYTPFVGNNVPLYDGNLFKNTQFSELYLALDSNSGHTGYHAANSNFDLYVFLDQADLTTVKLGSFKWSTNISRGTGAGTTELEQVNGIYVNLYDIDLRFGNTSGDIETVPARQATYVGTFRTNNSAGSSTDDYGLRFLWNAYNRIPQQLLLEIFTNTWNYSTNTYRPVDNDTGNKIEVVIGLDIDIILLSAYILVKNSSATDRTCAVGIGLDSTSTNYAVIRATPTVTNAFYQALSSHYADRPGIGFHEFTMLERGDGTDTQTWLGQGASGKPQAGMLGTFWS